ncbi:MAG: hypothetical protein A2096_06995 [Spirochaetes bacterium GWF1_41_5]|nr:MAG: hypothetical protein A2096_06995 [Spirochaetes bacterium GWF1_41_5]HBE03359.1 hypothetical protein [Spirochaetia bacterium]
MCNIKIIYFNNMAYMFLNSIKLLMHKINFFVAVRSNIFLLLALLISFISISSSFKSIKTFSENADEGYYLKYASEIGNKGPAEFPGLFKSYIENKEFWFYPNPLRIGHIFMTAFWLKIFGYTYINLAYFSLLCFSLFLIFSFFFVKKYFGSRIAVFFIILQAFSPLNMAMARRALMDACVNLFVFLTIWIFYENLKKENTVKANCISLPASKNQNLSLFFRWLFFIIFYAWTILIKENLVLLSVFFVFYVFINKWQNRRPLAVRAIFCATVLPWATVGCAYLLACGNFNIFADTVKIIIASPAKNYYALCYGSGPWFRYFIDFFLISPPVSLLAAGFIFYYLTQKKWQKILIYLILFSFIMLCIMNLFTKNIRYLIFLDMPLRLFAVLMIKNIAERFFTVKAKANRLLFLIILFAVSLDYSRFNFLFCKSRIYDPMTTVILKADLIVPTEEK